MLLNYKKQHSNITHSLFWCGLFKPRHAWLGLFCKSKLQLQIQNKEKHFCLYAVVALPYGWKQMLQRSLVMYTLWRVGNVYCIWQAVISPLQPNERLKLRGLQNRPHVRGEELRHNTTHPEWLLVRMLFVFICLNEVWNLDTWFSCLFAI